LWDFWFNQDHMKQCILFGGAQLGQHGVRSTGTTKTLLCSNGCA
jgi:hypothetical protein